MNKTDLIIALIKIRMSRAGQAEGMSKYDADSKAEAVIRQGNIGSTEALSTPEGSIVTIVETYMNSIGKAMVDAKVPNDSPQFENEYKRANDYIIEAIENHRNRVHPGEPNYPKNIDEYVFYRLKVEMGIEQGISPEAIGLDRPTVKVLTHTAKAELLKTIGATENGGGTSGGNSGGSKACFVATACFQSPNDPTVMILRQYREKVLKRSIAGRASIRWYYELGPRLAKYVTAYPIIRIPTSRALFILARLLRSVYRLY